MNDFADSRGPTAPDPPSPQAEVRSRPAIRLVGWALAVIGVLLAVVSVVAMSWASKAEDVTDLVRPELTDAGLAAHRADFETARDLVVGLRDRVLPALAVALGTTTDEFAAQIAGDYPAVGRLLDEEERILALAEKSLLNLERRQDQFERADALPTAGLAISIGPWVGVALGTVIAGCGCAVLLGRRRRKVRASLIVAAIAGAVLVLAPFALQVPGKAAAADAVLSSLDPSQGVVDQTEAARQTVRGAVDEFTNRLLPEVASTLGLTGGELDNLIEAEFPGATADLASMPAVLDRYDARVQIRATGAPLLRTLTSIPIVAVVWVVPFIGVVVMTVAAIGLLSYRRRPSTVQPSQAAASCPPSA